MTGIGKEIIWHNEKITAKRRALSSCLQRNRHNIFKPEVSILMIMNTRSSLSSSRHKQQPNYSSSYPSRGHSGSVVPTAGCWRSPRQRYPTLKYSFDGRTVAALYQNSFKAIGLSPSITCAPPEGSVKQTLPRNASMWLYLIDVPDVAPVISKRWRGWNELISEYICTCVHLTDLCDITLPILVDVYNTALINSFFHEGSLLGIRTR